MLEILRLKQKGDEIFEIEFIDKNNFLYQADIIYEEQAPNNFAHVSPIGVFDGDQEIFDEDGSLQKQADVFVRKYITENKFKLLLMTER